MSTSMEVFTTADGTVLRNLSVMVAAKGVLEATEDVILHQTSVTANKGYGLSDPDKGLPTNYANRVLLPGTKWPEEASRPTAGSIEVVHDPKFKATVVCLVGQHYHKNPDEAGKEDPLPRVLDTPELRIGWFKCGLERVAEYIKESKLASVALPYGIGCGLGGGAWSDYQDAIFTWAKENDEAFTVVLYKLAAPAVA